MAYDLVLHCLPMSHKKDARLKRVNLICMLGNFASIFVVCPCEIEFLTLEQFKNSS